MPECAAGCGRVLEWVAYLTLYEQVSTPQQQPQSQAQPCGRVMTYAGAAVTAAGIESPIPQPPRVLRLIGQQSQEGAAAAASTASSSMAEASQELVPPHFGLTLATQPQRDTLAGYAFEQRIDVAKVLSSFPTKAAASYAIGRLRRGVELNANGSFK